LGRPFRRSRSSTARAARIYNYGKLDIDLMNTTCNFLDLTAKGHDENPDAAQDWVRYHAKYKPAK
jgi:predicted dithiol-disulfide oxidoreductase (DUF899 family)